MLTLDSAACIAISLCTSGVTRTVNVPEKRLSAIGSVTDSPFAFMSATDSATTSLIPRNASSGLPASQLRLGNSAHKPTYSLSSSDHITLYVYRSRFVTIFALVGILSSFKFLLYSSYHLPDLIYFRFAVVILYIDSWIAKPRHLVDIVTTFRSRLS